MPHLCAIIVILQIRIPTELSSTDSYCSINMQCISQLYWHKLSNKYELNNRMNQSQLAFITYRRCRYRWRISLTYQRVKCIFAFWILNTVITQVEDGEFNITITEQYDHRPIVSWHLWSQRKANTVPHAFMSGHKQMENGTIATQWSHATIDVFACYETSTVKL